MLDPSKSVAEMPRKEISLDTLLEVAKVSGRPDEFLNCVGIAKFNLNELTEADNLYRNALKFVSNDDPAQRGRIQSNIGQVEAKLGGAQAALAKFEMALELLKEGDDKFNACITQLNIARLHLDRGNWNLARQIASDVKHVSTTQEYPASGSQIYCDAATVEAEALMHLGERDQAFAVSAETLRQKEVIEGGVNRLGSAFAFIDPNQFKTDPHSILQDCERIHRIAVEVGDLAVAWKASLLALDLGSRAFNKTQNRSDLERAVHMLRSCISGSKRDENPYLPEIQDRIADDLERNMDAFSRVLGREDLLLVFDTLAFLRPSDDRAKLRLERLNNTTRATSWRDIFSRLWHR